MYGAIGAAEDKHFPGGYPHRAADVTVEGAVDILNALPGEKIPDNQLPVVAWRFGVSVSHLELAYEKLTST